MVLTERDATVKLRNARQGSGGDTVVVNMDLGWHTWRRDEHVRLNGIDPPERSDLPRWAKAKAFVERLLPAGTEVLLVSEKLEKYGRTLGRLLLRDGRDVGGELPKSGLARPYAGGGRAP
jgi:micrococcal nuclease